MTGTAELRAYMPTKAAVEDWTKLATDPIASGRSWALVQADCISTLERLPPQSVDLIFADPPYHLSNGGSSCQSGKRVSVNKGGWDASRGLATDHAFQRAWLGAARRALKPSGTIWVSGTQHVIFSIGFAMQELGFHLLNTVTWYKPNASPNLACRMFTHSTEILLWASPSKGKPLAHRFNYREMKARNGGKQMRDLWQIPTPGPKEKVHGRHPTQKPIALLERVIAASATPGTLVIDPFCGSGTTGVAAVRAGCNFIGIENDPATVEIARRRLSSEEGR